MKDEYEFRPLEHSTAEIDQVSSLLTDVFPSAPHLTPAYLKWLYLENPEGRALGFNAFHEGRLVGHCAGQPLSAMVQGSRMKGILLLNAAVRRQHFRSNVTRRTTDPMFAQAAQQGFGFAIAVGNQNSTLPLLTRFRMLRPLDARIGLGLPRRSAASFEPSFARIWSHEALRWRLANPETRYTIRVNGGRLHVISPVSRRGLGAILYNGAVKWGVGEMGPAPQGPLRVWLGIDPSVAWKRSLYWPIPMRLRPSPLNLVFKDLSGGTLFPDPDRLLFQAIDFDAY